MKLLHEAHHALGAEGVEHGGNEGGRPAEVGRFAQLGAREVGPASAGQGQLAPRLPGVVERKAASAKLAEPEGKGKAGRPGAEHDRVAGRLQAGAAPACGEPSCFAPAPAIGDRDGGLPV